MFAYSHLQNNFNSFCLNSIVFENFKPAILVMNTGLATRVARYTRRRSFFFSSCINLRNSLFSFLTNMSNSGYVFKSLRRSRNLDRFLFKNMNIYKFVRLLRSLKLKRFSKFKFKRKRSKLFRKVVMLVSSKRFFNKFIKRFRESHRHFSIKQRLPFSSLAFSNTTSPILVRSTARVSKKKLRSRKYKKRFRKRFSFILASIFQVFRSQFYKQFNSLFYSTVSYNTYFNAFNGTVFPMYGLFFKKLLRLFIFQFGMKNTVSASTISSMKYLIFSHFATNSFVSKSVFLRFYTTLSSYYSSLVESFLSLKSCSSASLHIGFIFSSYLASTVVHSVPSFNSQSFFNFMSNFRSLLRSKYYSFIFSDLQSIFERTFHFYANNSSARNFFSALHKGDKMLYGNTSGSFKLRKRLKYRKHASYMIASTFHRTISTYYKSGRVRAVYLNLTGYRRAFRLVISFFRNQLKYSGRFHWRPAFFVFRKSLRVFRKLGRFAQHVHQLQGSTFSLCTKSCGSKKSSIGFVNSVFSRLLALNVPTTPINRYARAKVAFLYSNISRNYSTFSGSGRRYKKKLGSSYKHFNFIKPSINVDVTDVVSTSSSLSNSFIYHIPTVSIWLYTTTVSSVFLTKFQRKEGKLSIAELIQAAREGDVFDFQLFKYLPVARRFFFKKLRLRVLLDLQRNYKRTSSRRSTSAVSSLYSSIYFTGSASARTYASGVRAHTKSRVYRAPALKKVIRQPSSVSLDAKKRSFNRKLFLQKKRKRFGRFFKSKSLNRKFKSFSNNYKGVLSVFRNRMSSVLDLLFSGSTMRYRPVISHGGCYRRRRYSDRRYWF